MRKTKIICTLGPASDSTEMIEKLILSGMNAARFNFSHGTHESHLAVLTRFKQVRDRLGMPVAAVLDTKGPEIRTGLIEGGIAVLEAGSEFTLTTERIIGKQNIVSVTYPELHSVLLPGNRVLIDDGLIELAVERTEGRNIICRVITGGALSNSKGVNLPGIPVDLPSLTEKDREDLRLAAEQGFDFVAASFIRCAQDVHDIRAHLALCGGENIGIIAKIENSEGVENLDEIIDAADGIMVARGDLGVEIPAYEVPMLQKAMISGATGKGKLVITATQMLDSMMRNPRPTRAEVSDVANAVFDGTSCVMLSGETASGKYPLEALATMNSIVCAAEESVDYWHKFSQRSFPQTGSVSNAISHSSCLTAMDLNAAAILTATKRGFTARMISRYRPACPIIAFCTEESVCRGLSLVWGVTPFLSGSVDSTDRLFTLCAEDARMHGIVSPGDTVVITAGVPIGKSGTTNLIKVQEIR